MNSRTPAVRRRWIRLLPVRSPLEPLIFTSRLIGLRATAMAGPSMMGMAMSVTTTAIVSRSSA